MPSTMTPQSSSSNFKVETKTLEDSEQSIKSDEDPQLGLFHQVYDWLQHEKNRRMARKARRAEAVSGNTNAVSESEEHPAEEQRCSESSFSLGELEKILAQFAGPQNVHGLASHLPFKRPARRRPRGLRRGSASDSDVTDVEAPVPNVEAHLDNSKTLAYTTGAGDDETSESIKRSKDREAWIIFKTEIVRLAHTLQLRGWRKMSMDKAEEVEVHRLSGALTNAVYVVVPPKPVYKTENGSAPVHARRPPP
jgi:choline kinase